MKIGEFNWHGKPRFARDSNQFQFKSNGNAVFGISPSKTIWQKMTARLYQIIFALLGPERTAHALLPL